MKKRLDHQLLTLFVVAGLSFAVGESVAKPSSGQSGQNLNSAQPFGISVISPGAIRSGVVYWDYRVGLYAQPVTVLTVSADKIFVLTDIVFSPLIEPTGFDSDPIDLKVYEDTTLKTVILYPKDQIHFSSGIPFAPGSQVNLSQPHRGTTPLANVVFGITFSGYEYAPSSFPTSSVYLPFIVSSK